MAGSSKKSKGRQKIEMKKIEDEDQLLVTFSKRRSGVNRKANELATMCGAELAVLVYSPAGKPFTYGNPSVESVVNRYLNQQLPPSDNIQALVEANRKVSISQLTEQYNQLDSTLDAERRRSKILEQLNAGHGKGPHGWWDTPTDQADAKELENLLSYLENFRSQVYGAMDEKQKGEASSSMAAPAAASTHTQLTNMPFPANPNDLEFDQHVLPALPPATLPGLGFGPGAASSPHDQLTSTHPLPTMGNIPFPANAANDFDELSCILFPPPNVASDDDPQVLPAFPPANP